MRQRALIAIAIARGPSLLVADEPTSALDATVEAGILALFRELQAESGMGILLVTHGPRGRRAERPPRGRDVRRTHRGDGAGRRPARAPAASLHGAAPALAPCAGRARERLASIPGRVPAPSERLPGCRFRDRCPIAKPRCAELEPELLTLPAPDEDRAVACHYDEEASHSERAPDRGAGSRREPRRRARGRGRLARGRRGRDARAGGGVGEREDDDRPRDPAPRRGAGRASAVPAGGRPPSRSICSRRRRRRCGRCAASSRSCSRTRSRASTRAARRGKRSPRGSPCTRSRAGGGRGARGRAHRARRARAGEGRELPARALGRRAAADRDRAGARARSALRRARRAGLGARRVRAGAGPEPPRWSCRRSAGSPTSSSRTTWPSCGTSPTASR
jgi:oligopeptide/dipeptide ABC transporter ATP-binding protein